MHAIMLSCHESTLLLTKNEYQKLSARENMQIKMHLMGCKFCRAFEKQNKVLTEKIQQINTHPVDLELENDKKNHIQHNIDNQINKDSTK